MPYLDFRAKDFVGPHKASLENAPFASTRAEVVWGRCHFDWDALIQAAVTFGKGQLFRSVAPGYQVYLEEVYRTNIPYANLVEDSSGALHYSTISLQLDPTEKGFVSYFLGMTIAKMFAQFYLDVPWLMHLDVYADQYGGATLGSLGSEKPDLIGLNSNSEWVVFEAKGRSGGLKRDVMSKAKSQTRNLRSIGPDAPVLRVAMASYVKAGALCVELEDPEDIHPQGIVLPHNIVNRESFLRLYYQRFLDLFNQRQDGVRRERIDDRLVFLLEIPESDMSLGIDERVLRFLRDADYGRIAQYLSHFRDNDHDQPNVRSGFGSDGIIVVLGARWQAEQMRMQPQERH